MVEIEIGVMVDQCLDRRIPDKATLIKEIAAWERRRNAEKARIEWMFTIDRARAKLGRVASPPACRSSRPACGLNRFPARVPPQPSLRLEPVKFTAARY